MLVLTGRLPARPGFTARCDLLEARHQEVVDWSPDCIFLINVLEHVPQDQALIEELFSVLRPGGHLCLFVPALPVLLGAFDREIGHVRRYLQRPLEAQARQAGFDIVKSRYLDFLGVFPWFLKFRLLQSTQLSPGNVRIYDRFVVPWLRRVEAVCPPPFGKNLLMVLRRP